MGGTRVRVKQVGCHTDLNLFIYYSMKLVWFNCAYNIQSKQIANPVLYWSSVQEMCKSWSIDANRIVNEWMAFSASKRAKLNSDTLEVFDREVSFYCTKIWYIPALKLIKTIYLGSVIPHPLSFTLSWAGDLLYMFVTLLIHSHSKHSWWCYLFHLLKQHSRFFIIIFLK